MEGNKRVRFGAFLVILLAVFILTSIVLETVVMNMVVSSSSMYPTTKTGDIWIGLRHTGPLSRGDIVVFTVPGEDGYLIKRLIGLPGDAVAIDEAGTVSVNGEAVEERYVRFQRTGKPQDYLVPDGHVFLLGDNRAQSYDSRYWEPPYLHVDQIKAKAVLKFEPPVFLAILAACILTVAGLSWKGGKRDGKHFETATGR